MSNQHQPATTDGDSKKQKQTDTSTSPQQITTSILHSVSGTVWFEICLFLDAGFLLHQLSLTSKFFCQFIHGAIPQKLNISTGGSNPFGLYNGHDEDINENGQSVSKEEKERKELEQKQALLTYRSAECCMLWKALLSRDALGYRAERYFWVKEKISGQRSTSSSSSEESMERKAPPSSNDVPCRNEEGKKVHPSSFSSSSSSSSFVFVQKREEIWMASTTPLFSGWQSALLLSKAMQGAKAQPILAPHGHPTSTFHNGQQHPDENKFCAKGIQYHPQGPFRFPFPAILPQVIQGAATSNGLMVSPPPSPQGRPPLQHLCGLYLEWYALLYQLTRRHRPNFHNHKKPQQKEAEQMNGGVSYPFETSDGSYLGLWTCGHGHMVGAPLLIYLDIEWSVTLCPNIVLRLQNLLPDRDVDDLGYGFTPGVFDHHFPSSYFPLSQRWAVEVLQAYQGKNNAHFPMSNRQSFRSKMIGLVSEMLMDKIHPRMEALQTVQHHDFVTLSQSLQGSCPSLKIGGSPQEEEVEFMRKRGSASSSTLPEEFLNPTTTTRAKNFDYHQTPGFEEGEEGNPDEMEEDIHTKNSVRKCIPCRRQGRSTPAHLLEAVFPLFGLFTAEYGGHGTELLAIRPRLQSVPPVEKKKGCRLHHLRKGSPKMDVLQQEREQHADDEKEQGGVKILTPLSPIGKSMASVVELSEMSIIATKVVGDVNVPARVTTFVIGREMPCDKAIPGEPALEDTTSYSSDTSQGFDDESENEVNNTWMFLPDSDFLLPSSSSSSASEEEKETKHEPSHLVAATTTTTDSTQGRITKSDKNCKLSPSQEESQGNLFLPQQYPERRKNNSKKKKKKKDEVTLLTELLERQSLPVQAVLSTLNEDGVSLPPSTPAIQAEEVNAHVVVDQGVEGDHSTATNVASSNTSSAVTTTVPQGENPPPQRSFLQRFRSYYQSSIQTDYRREQEMLDVEKREQQRGTRRNPSASSSPEENRKRKGKQQLPSTVSHVPSAFYCGKIQAAFPGFQRAGFVDCVVEVLLAGEIKDEGTSGQQPNLQLTEEEKRTRENEGNADSQALPSMEEKANQDHHQGRTLAEGRQQVDEGCPHEARRFSSSSTRSDCFYLHVPLLQFTRRMQRFTVASQ